MAEEGAQAEKGLTVWGLAAQRRSGAEGSEGGRLEVKCGSDARIAFVKKVAWKLLEK